MSDEIEVCKALEIHRDGRGCWASRRCDQAPNHISRHMFTAWTYHTALTPLSDILEGRWTGRPRTSKESR